MTQLQYFVTTAEEQHMTNAAFKLNITQPALSAAISKIEDEVGVKLFNRIGRQIVLNESGEILYNYATIILSSYNTALQKLESRKKRSLKTIVVAVSGIEAPEPILLAFRKANPDITINQFMFHISDLNTTINRFDVDFVFTNSLPDIRTAYRQAEVFRDRLVLVVPPEHPFASRSSISLSEAKNESFVSMPENTAYRSMTDSLCLKAGFYPNTVLEAYSNQLSTYVEQTGAIAIINKASVKRHTASADVRFVPLSDDFCHYDMYLLWRDDLAAKPKYIRGFYDFVIENAASLTNLPE